MLWPGVVAAAVQLGRGRYVALVTPMDAANAVDYATCGRCGNQPVCDAFTKSFLGDAAVL